MAPLTEFDILVAMTRLVRIEELESVNGALWQNSHGGNELLGTVKVSARCSITGSQTYIEERLRGARRVLVVAGEGQGGDC